LPFHNDELADFEFDGFSWDGRLSTEWTGAATDISINSDEFTGQDYEKLSNETKEYVGKIAAAAADSFAVLERFLFEHYQANIFLNLYPECEYAPRIDKPPEIWKLVSQPSIHIPSSTGRSNYNVGFYTMFDCIWGPEHGFAVEHDHDFLPQSVIDIDQCCY